MQKKIHSIIYRLRRHGVEVDTRHRTILIPYGDDPFRHRLVCRLFNEFHFNIQYIIT